MQKFIFPVLLLFIFACNQKSQKQNTINNNHTIEGTTTIEFEENMHDFGQLSAGEIVIYSFEFTNTGNGAYKIENVDSDCACVQIRYQKKVVPAGEKGQIEVEFDTSGLVGKEFKSIEVRGNSKELKHLAIFAEVKNELLEFKY